MDWTVIIIYLVVAACSYLALHMSGEKQSLRRLFFCTVFWPLAVVILSMAMLYAEFDG